ncbi:MAG: signal recognition particle-docking protein FtsY [Thermoprotei archaeon]|nr:MAG: signal recognition particle-docking protein FtsY [Thermoprotei archaeon]
MFNVLKRAFSSIADVLATTKLTEKDIDKHYLDIITPLLEGDVALPVADYIVEELKSRAKQIKVPRFGDRSKDIRRILREIVIEILNSTNPVDIFELADKKRRVGEPLVILFVGPNGHGKTTTIAKLAYAFRKRNYSVVLAAADTYRAGAIEQLKEHANRLRVKVVEHKYGADPAAVAYDAVLYAKKRRINVVLIDTAGRMQTDKDLMDEMRKIARVVDPDLVIFVGDALTGNDALEEALKFHEAVNISCSILTKADADAKGGAALSIVYATKRPVIFLGTGQRYEDLIPFSTEWFLKRLGLV